jgi:broad specificity phosphatase PhoE
MDTVHRSDGLIDLPLSDSGRLGLIAAQQYLKTVPLRVIYAAPLKRTTETAEIIRSGVLSDPKIIICPEAITWDLGKLSGMQKRYSRPEVDELLKHPAVRAPSGESYSNFKRRYVPWFYGRAASAKKPILIVGSGSNFRLLGDVLFDDPEALNLDEGGLAILRQLGGWHKEIILGEEDTSHYES